MPDSVDGAPALVPVPVLLDSTLREEAKERAYDDSTDATSYDSRSISSKGPSACPSCWDMDWKQRSQSASRPASALKNLEHSATEQDWHLMS